MEQRLKNKAAIITGGARGIGAAITRKFAENGANVFITYSKSATEAEKLVAECQKLGVKAEAIKADAANPSEVKKVIEKIAKEHGLDILVNNAGIFAGQEITECSDEDFDKTMNVNQKSVFVSMRAAAKVMKKGGRIINIGSVLGERVNRSGLTLYAMSKFAVAGMTRGVARDLGPKGITVNCIEPGPINTDMNPEDSEWAKEQKAGLALGRYGQPIEIANTALFLASSDSSNITGAMIAVDSGYLA